jgi:hypothetical protein
LCNGQQVPRLDGAVAAFGPRQEVASSQVKAAAKEELDSGREGAHDDLVPAVAAAGWVGEHAMRPFLIRP